MTQEAKNLDLRTYETTYRYLRIGLIGVVALLAVSVAIEMSEQQWCSKGSISAYYHTPVRLVFVGGLIAVGFGLIVLRGKPDWRDTLLNISGAYAPIVALVPAQEDGLCTGAVANTDTGLTATEVVTVSNNINSLFAAGAFGLIATIVVILVDKARRGNINHINNGARRGYALLAILIIGTYVIFRANETWFLSNAHGYAAGIMFGSLALLSLFGIASDSRLRYAYFFIGIGMIGSAAFIYVFFRDWDHYILVIEVIEIALFALYWILQTVDQWSNVEDLEEREAEIAATASTRDRTIEQ